MRRLVLLAVALGCSGEDAEVLEAPNKYKACNSIVTCDPGLECRGGVCLPPLAPPVQVNGGEDTSGASGEDVPPVGGDDTAVTPPDDVASAPDLAGPPDDVAVVEPDTSVEPPDVPVVEDVAPQPDECTAAGQPGGCPFEPALTYCRYEPKTKNLVCQEGAFRVYSEPCTESAQCELQLGCHFGVCTEYCELAFKNCPANATCTDIGHPTFGACKQGQ